MNMYEYVNSYVFEMYNVSLNMWTPEYVQLKSSINIVVGLKFGLPKSRFI